MVLERCERFERNSMPERWARPFKDLSQATPLPMTIDATAQPTFDQHNLSRDDVLLAAKCVAQRIIDDSQDSDDMPPLSGLVYDVWGLYNDGMPKCRWTSPYENDDLLFSGQFRVDDDDTFVTRRAVLSPGDLDEVLTEVNVPHAG